ncbi:uncharacterized protein PGTG_17749 [Puccinia graminis f. sp. tritici CRL 75-36-700-3]|uniref:Uncharacterized protein n=1 Tax=Puccinia graminis f. sp. tritici (strain CRL 75-36-700-3 / race SCCL) TaxID=418459 RepID=E3L4M4_PUCGT|nr:uncharacterized protein PGTG_17749 [Puccinia graminis f. sp. tritici CRL 75-36-700-3]EFP91499.2 hypothetical protein PGTG_17749 [Puccinia graminis f. sp. tritici CRL 75-36-700-3]
MVAFLSITQSNAYNCDNAFQRIPNTPNSVVCQTGLVALSDWIFSDCVTTPAGWVKNHVRVKEFTVNIALHRIEIWGHKFWPGTFVPALDSEPYHCPMSHENLRRATCPNDQCVPL